MPNFDVRDRFVLAHSVHQSVVFGSLTLRRVRKRLAQHFLGGITEDLFRPSIPETDMMVRVESNDCLG